MYKTRVYTRSNQNHSHTLWQVSFALILYQLIKIISTGAFQNNPNITITQKSQFLMNQDCLP